jgi:hypothetical protein
MTEDKHSKFRRLAVMRGERVLKDLDLLSNLANRNNYSYTDEEVKVLFGAIDDALRSAKGSFNNKKERGIRL